MSGPMKKPLDLGGSNPEWVALDSSMLAGGIKGQGTRVTSVNTPWAINGNRLSCNITVSIGCDGIPEGYTWAADAAIVLAKLGVTFDELRFSNKRLITGMRMKSTGGPAANMGIAFGRSIDNSGNVSTLVGGGGGIRSGANINTNIASMAFDSLQESINGTFIDLAGGSVITEFTWSNDYVSTSSYLQIDGQSKLARRSINFSGFTGNVDYTPYIIVWAGGASTGVVSPDFEVWFSVLDGPAFLGVPV